MACPKKLAGQWESVKKSVYSVEDINAGAVAWLSTPTWSSDPKIAIPAGTTIPEFKRLIRQSGGKIYVEEKE